MKKSDDRWVSVDPSTTTPGVALWEGQELKRAYCLKAKELPGLIQQEQCDHVVIELPQVYRNTRNPAAIIKLAFAAGMITASFNPEQITTYLPRTWKGQVPKDIMVGRIIAKVTDAEMGNVTVPGNKKHALDMWDAVGIGLYHVGRL